ncbi:MAG: LptF/LptG family permease [Rikenellaceae bacterium]
MRLKTSDKFILRSYLGPMFATFFIVTFILLMNVLWRYIDELVGKGLPFSAIVEMLFFTTSTMLPMGLPLCTLLAAIMTMGSLGENNELLALKAAGVSLPRIMTPIIIVAALVSVGSFFIINNYVPYSARKMSSLLHDIRQQRQEISFQDGVFFNGIPDISIRVDKQEPNTKKLLGILIYDTRDTKTSKTIVADSGYIDLVDDNQYMNIKLFNGQNYEDNRSYSWYTEPDLTHHKFDIQELSIALEGFNFERSDKNNVFSSSSETMNMVELQKNIDTLSWKAEASIKTFKGDFFKKNLFASDTNAVFHRDSVASIKRHKFMLTSDMIDTLSVENKARLYDDVSTKLANMKFFVKTGHSSIAEDSIPLYRSNADWHKKISLPVSVFIFFLIGAPLGAIIRRGGLGLPIVIAVLFFIFYYIIFITGDKMVKDGSWTPFFGMWLSSIILFPIAIFLTYKATTDSQLLNIELYYNFFRKIKAYIYRITPDKFKNRVPKKKKIWKTKIKKAPFSTLLKRH